MSLKILRDQQEISCPEELLKLQGFCLDHGMDLTLEWIEGQYWLHSDLSGERPIGIQVDQEIQRHLDYFKKSSLHKEILARAIGIKGAKRPAIIDLSAGLLGDSLLMLAMGCSVVALERNPIVATLIKSSLQKAQHPLLKNFTFIESDASPYLRNLNQSPEVIYFDPMFEDASDKSLPKKEMRIFRSIVGKDKDAVKTFEEALNTRPKRLVVKRPRLSKELIEGKPLSFVGKSTRYDVYLS